MEYLGAFLFGGVICLIGQIILDNTKFTAGHLTSLFVVLGSILGFFGIYDYFLDNAHAGANMPITSFGNSLFNASYNGYLENGFLGIFTGMLSTTSGIISATIIFSFVLGIIFKPRD